MKPNGLLPALALLLLLGACGQNPEPGANAPAGPQPADCVTIMTFNVENLFDTRDDPGKDDRTYLPLELKQTEEHRAACARIDNERWRDQCLNWDWSEEIVDRKLAAVAEAILQVQNGRGADVIALQEVENLTVLERLSNEYLAAAGYEPAILIEGDDERGIDVALLSRLPLAAPPALHRIQFEGVEDEHEADTRGILEATFRLPDGSLLTGYAVHFPAPFHPTEMRIAAYDALNGLLAALPEDRPAFAAGDFNTTSAEDREQSMLERFVRPYWTVAHESGCGGCRGTSYYQPTGEWSFLDMILWASAKSRGAETTWRLQPDSTAIANATAAQITAEKTPARFTLPGGTGLSDHWPLVAVIELK
jgi:endonuclease/exonuclease/phosphatase family metal-dependent hydrolase